MGEVDAANLTPTEMCILRMMVGEMSDAEIAFVLDTSKGDVEIQIDAILRKFGSPNRQAATRFALETQLIQAELL